MRAAIILVAVLLIGCPTSPKKPIVEQRTEHREATKKDSGSGIGVKFGPYIDLGSGDMNTGLHLGGGGVGFGF